MPLLTVTITDQEAAILLTDMLSIQDWLDNAIRNKIRQQTDSIIMQQTNIQPSKLGLIEKGVIVGGLTLTKAADRPTT